MVPKNKNTTTLATINPSGNLNDINGTLKQKRPKEQR